jgi:hypothetical protein
VEPLALTLLDEALASSYGVAVRTNNVKRLATALEQAVASHGNTYNNLSVEPSRDAPQTELWIVKCDE